MTRVDLAVIADGLDDGVGPFRVEADGLAERGVDAEEALDRRILALEELVDVLAGDAPFLGLDRGVDRPVDDLQPAVVAAGDGRRERLLRQALRQQQIVVRALELGQLADEVGRILGDGVDAAGFERGDELARVLDGDGREGGAALAEEVGDVELARGAALDADGGAVEIGRLLDADILAHQDALSVIEDGRAEMETELEGARDGDGDARKQHVELACLKRRQALLRRGRGELDLLRIAEHGDGERAAVVDEKALPAAAGIRREEARRGADADLDRAALGDAVERRPGLGAGRNKRGGDRGGRRHRPSPAEAGLENGSHAGLLNGWFHERTGLGGLAPSCVQDSRVLR